MNPNQQTSATAKRDKNLEDVINYYDTCWLNRFSEGHNPKSYAMHFGVFRNGVTDNDSAKLETNKLLAELLGVPTRETSIITDLGCGVGGTCAYLAEHFQEARIVGVNISATQIAQAEKLIRMRGLLGRVSFVRADYRSTPLENDSVNHAFALESLWHAEKKALVFQEAARVLKKGGTFVVIDYFQTRPASTAQEAEALTVFNNGWGAYEEGTGPVKVFGEDYGRELTEAGFSRVASESLLPLVLPGIRRSFEKARNETVKEGLAANLYKHYKACIALMELVEAGLMDYRSVVANR